MEMIIGVNSETNTISQLCINCGKVNEWKIEYQDLEWIEEFNEYRNYNIPECECYSMESLNMNLPDDEYDISHYIPDDEWYARNIIKNIKKFFLGETENISDEIPPKKPYRNPYAPITSEELEEDN